MRFVIAVCACVSCGLARALCVCVRERDFQKAFFNTPLIKGKESLLFKKKAKTEKNNLWSGNIRCKQNFSNLIHCIYSVRVQKDYHYYSLSNCYIYFLEIKKKSRLISLWNRSRQLRAPQNSTFVSGLALCFEAKLNEDLREQKSEFGTQPKCTRSSIKRNIVAPPASALKGDGLARFPRITLAFSFPRQPLASLSPSKQSTAFFVFSAILQKKGGGKGQTLNGVLLPGRMRKADEENEGSRMKCTPTGNSDSRDQRWGDTDKQGRATNKVLAVIGSGRWRFHFARFPFNITSEMTLAPNGRTRNGAKLQNGCLIKELSPRKGTQRSAFDRARETKFSFVSHFVF